MKHARVVFQDVIHHAIETNDGHLKLDNGQIVSEEEVVWLPPVQPRTVLL